VNKKCLRCQETKPLKDFYRRKDSKKVKHMTWCKACQRKITAARYQARYATQWVELLKKKYGITEEDYNAFLLLQGGVCAICKTDPDKKRLSVDHCHKTKKVRALLCRHCNLMLGLAKDEPATLDRAAAYLRGHSK
jgi:hypothetical protein